MLEAARSAGIKIPLPVLPEGRQRDRRLPHLRGGGQGAKSLVASCVYPVSEGMEVFTNTEQVRKSRQLTLELILSNHRMDCLTCARSSNCELQQLAAELGIDAVRFAADNPFAPDRGLRRPSGAGQPKCVLCRRCTAVCRKAQEVGVIGSNDRGFDTHIGCAFDRDLDEVDCVSCGQCIVACPTGALPRRTTPPRSRAAGRPRQACGGGPRPSVRGHPGRVFGLPMGTNVEGKMVTALRRLGFDKVFDVDNAADFTIMEEGTEFLRPPQNGGALPMITSCSPGWIRYCEQHHPDMLDNLSSCKSPSRCSVAW